MGHMAKSVVQGRNTVNKVGGKEQKYRAKGSEMLTGPGHVQIPLLGRSPRGLMVVVTVFAERVSGKAYLFTGNSVLPRSHTAMIALINHYFATRYGAFLSLFQRGKPMCPSKAIFR
jgi:hypothetical protein